MQLTGIHHLTAISAQPRASLAFYTGLLGMRLVKKTVNQDDVSAYHLFYADGKANPGTDLTFFDFPADPERRGTNSISRTGLRVAGESSLGYWRERLKQAGGHTGDIVEVDGRLTLPFEDGEGQRLVLVDDGGTGPASPWERSPVPSEHQIRGLGPIVLTVHELSRTAFVLTEVMNMRRVRDYAAHGAHIHVFVMGEGGPAAAVLKQRRGAGAAGGAAAPRGVAHAGRAQYQAWTQRLRELGIPNSGEIDRFYFRSLYFREPNGILFEIATGGPGFATDEPMATLGENLALPPFLEPRRKEIEAGLKPIVSANRSIGGAQEPALRSLSFSPCQWRVPPLAFPSRNFRRQCVHLRFPEISELPDPAVHRLQPRRIHRIESPLRVRPHPCKSAFAQHLEMLRHRRLRDPELFLSPPRLRRTPSPPTEQFEDAPAHWIREDVEDVHQLPVHGCATPGGFTAIEQRSCGPTAPCRGGIDSACDMCRAPELAALAHERLPLGEPIQASAASWSGDTPVTRCCASPMTARSQPIPTAPGPNWFQWSSMMAV